MTFSRGMTLIKDMTHRLSIQIYVFICVAGHYSTHIESTLIIHMSNSIKTNIFFTLIHLFVFFKYFFLAQFHLYSSSIESGYRSGLRIDKGSRCVLRWTYILLRTLM